MVEVVKNEIYWAELELALHPQVLERPSIENIWMIEGTNWYGLKLRHHDYECTPQYEDKPHSICNGVVRAHVPQGYRGSKLTWCCQCQQPVNVMITALRLDGLDI